MRSFVSILAAIALALAAAGSVSAAAPIRLTVPSVDYDDPFVGFRAVTPLFELNSDGTRYEIPPARLKFFSPESFAANKPADEYRIFILGGSTVQGEPYLPQTSFTTWLEIGLQAADPSRRWEVVNCGGVSYASYRLLPIMQELMAREPDLFIFYEGHNEFLEDRTYEHIKHAPWLVAAAQESLGRLRTRVAKRDFFSASCSGSRATGRFLRSMPRGSAGVTNFWKPTDAPRS